MQDSKDVSVPLGRGHDPVSIGKEGVSISLGRKPIRFSARALSDVVFVIDTTGSMDNEIDGLLRTSQNFVDELEKRNIDWRVATVSFGDLTVAGDRILATPFSADVEITKRSLRQIPRNSGGGNDGESSLEAMVKAMGLPGYRPNSIRLLVLMTDEPALQGPQLTAKSVTEQLRKNGFLCFVISEPQPYFKEMAAKTGGDWFQISSNADFLRILDRLAQQVSQIVEDVQRLGQGDVQEYLRLRGGG